MKENILRTVQAYQNCLKSENAEWATKHYEKIKDTLLPILPHGSGINGVWKIQIDKNKIVCRNFYDVMDSQGFYDRYIDFKLIICTDRRDIEGKLSWRLQGMFSKYAGLREYLEESFYTALENL